MLRMGDIGDQPSLVDVREHRFQLGVVGTLTVALAATRKPKLVAALAAATAFPVLPVVFRRFVAPQIQDPARFEDARLPAFARIAGGAGLLAAAVLAALAPSKLSHSALFVAGGVCLYGSATGCCVPCSSLVALEKARVVSLDPPLVCALRT